ncbi:MAG: protein kinase [Deltaproteobacteria bacterium]|nr:protein kinase [Deltaproteobacteria bacterium]
MPKKPPQSESDKVPQVVVDPRRPEMELDRRLVIREVIDGGGMADIHTSFDANLMRTVATKALREDFEQDDSTPRRLIEEAQMMAQLEHPNIVPVHELGTDDENRLFFTMKLVRGDNLRRMLSEADFRTRTTSQLFDHLQIFVKICDAVAFANSRGVIHRDLKPDNVMVGQYGEVYVMDWGIAMIKNQARPSNLDRELPSAARAAPRYRVHDEDGLIIGTPGYMAPEQARGEIELVDERTDVYSLGAILYTILTKAPPHFGRNSHELVLNTLTVEIKPPQELVDFELPPQLCQIAMRALSTSPDDRQATALELKREVEEFLQSGWHFPSREFAAGSSIIREGEQGDEAYVITAGRCRATKLVSGKDVVLREMGPGDVFGETAVLTGGERTASVTAVTAVSAIAVAREHFEEEMGLGFFLGRFAKTLAERFREKDERATELEVDLDETELTIRLLKYVCFSGKQVGSERVEVSWSELCEVFAENLGKPAEEIARALERIGLFDIDPERDVLSLSRYL